MSRRVLGLAVLVLVLLGFLAGYFWLGPASFGGSARSGVSTATYRPVSTSAVHRGHGVVLGYLPSLNGTLHCFNPNLTRVLWDRMRDFNASDPRINRYVSWLSVALGRYPSLALTNTSRPVVKTRDGMGLVVAGHYRFWWMDEFGFLAEPPRLTNQVVRMGVVKLAFGTALVVTAYQVGDHLDIVVHATIINTTEYMHTLFHRALSAAFTMMGPPANPRIDRVLFRIRLVGRGSYLQTPNGMKLPIRYVYVLVEMPVLIDTRGGIEIPQPEFMAWMVLGRPALGLALQLAYPPNTWHMAHNNIQATNTTNNKEPTILRKQPNDRIHTSIKTRQNKSTKWVRNTLLTKNRKRSMCRPRLGRSNVHSNSTGRSINLPQQYYTWHGIRGSSIQNVR